MTDEDSEWEDFSEDEYSVDEDISEYADAERITLRFNYGIVQWDQ